MEENLISCTFFLPRTETTAYPPSFDLHGALAEQANHPAWGRVVQYLLSSGRIDRPEVCL